MKDSSLLLSLVLASAFHGALLLAKLPSTAKTPPVIPPLVEVNLIESASSKETGSPPSPAAAQFRIPAKSRAVPRLAAQPQPVAPPQPMKPEPVPAPQPTPVEPEPIKTAFVEEPEIGTPSILRTDVSESAEGMTGLSGENFPTLPTTDTSMGGGTGDTSDRSSAGSGDGSSGNGIGVDKMPAYSYNPKPKYPSAARRAGQEGTVILRVEVLFSGKVNKIVLEKSTGFGLLDKEAIGAVRKWEFSPARKGTRPVTTWVRIPIEFSLRDEYE